jgi:hypothetical protein
MLKKLLSVMLAAMVVSQGIARADEPARSIDVKTEPNQAALLAHLDGMTPGDRLAVATGDGVVAGELVDKDADDVVIDRPLIAGGVERVAIPLKEIQGVRYQSANPPQVRPSNRAWIITAVVVGALILVARLGFLAPGP